MGQDDGWSRLEWHLSHGGREEPKRYVELDQLTL